MSDRKRKKLAAKHGKGNITSVDQGNLRRIRIDRHWGLCRTNGEMVLEPQFDTLTHFLPNQGAWYGKRDGRTVKLIRSANGQIVEDDLCWDLLHA